jgi:phenylalanyl-tRNA synthetase beta chain
LDSAQVTSGGRTKEQNDELKLKKSLCEQGCYESIFYSFFSPSDLDMINLPEDAKERKAIRLINPISEDLSIMRTILAPSMINAIVRNVRRLNTQGRFFEIANVFHPKSLPLEDYPEETKKICIGVFGNDETFFTTKGIVETVAQQYGLKLKYEVGQMPFLHPGMTAKITCDGEEIGYIGKLSYDVCEKLALEIPAFVAELNYDIISNKANDKLVYKPIPKFAEEVRDLALVMDESVTCETVCEAISSSNKYITSVTLFDVYRSKKIGEGKKSLAFKLVFTPDDHEFTGDEIDKYIQKILKKLSFTLNIEIR